MFESIPVIPSPASDRLIMRKAASRIAAADSTLYDFSKEVVEFAGRFMGWTSLASNPPFDPAEINAFARGLREEGLDDVVLIGQGGSTQASMTMAALLRNAGRLEVRFHTMDVLVPQRVREVLDSVDPSRTIFIVSSKSGSTIEPTMVFKCVWEDVCHRIGEEAAGRRFVAITDPGSKLEAMAAELGFLKTFPGLPNVGGRFSALSVFGLVPFALMGVDVEALLEECAKTQEACSLDSLDNPAIRLAAFIKECHMRDRDKIVFHFSDSCLALGMWLEQLVAESLGKLGRGVLPSTERDMGLACRSAGDRCVIVYTMAMDEEGPAGQSRGRIESIPADVPSLGLVIDDPLDVASHFILWEYAVAMMASLIGINAFDQPNVESTKVAVRLFLYGPDGNDSPAPRLDPGDFLASVSDDFVAGFEMSRVLSRDAAQPKDLDDVLGVFFASMRKDDYFSLNAFLQADEGEEHEILEGIRRSVAETSGCVSCFEVGPRYLHSIGQFQKGAQNKGLILIVSADSEGDLPIPGEGFALGELLATQARGDFVALDDSNRRAVHVHLKDAGPQTLRALAEIVSRHIPARLG